MNCCRMERITLHIIIYPLKILGGQTNMDQGDLRIIINLPRIIRRQKPDKKNDLEDFMSHLI